MSLDDIRKHIDQLDREIVGLLDRRARAGQEAAREKRALDLPLHNPSRENEIIRRLAALSDGSMPAKSLANIYRVIMTETLALEETRRPSVSPCGHVADKQDVQAVVMENREEAPGFFRMRVGFSAPAPRFKPGQFFQLRVDDRAGQPFLRRPFAPSEAGDDGFSFFYAVVGEGTRMMSGLPIGARVGVLAPLGNAYTLPSGGSRALLLGGGCGAPSIAPLARCPRDAGVHVTILVGARTAGALLNRDAFALAADRLLLATDDGSHGCRGTVIDAYRLDEASRNSRPDRIYACGPTPMLKAAARLAAELDVECEVSLEERMACGFGACMGCAVPVRDDQAEGGFVYRRVCHEGPVFDAKKLVWDR